MTIETFSDMGLDFSTSRLHYHVSTFKNMVVAVNRPYPLYDIAAIAPLRKFLEITPAL